MFCFILSPVPTGKKSRISCITEEMLSDISLERKFLPLSGVGDAIPSSRAALESI